MGAQEGEGEALYVKEGKAGALEQSLQMKLELDVNDKGVVRNVLQNYVKVLEADEYLKGTIRYNALDGRPEVSGVYWGMEPHPIRDNDLSNLRQYLSIVYDLSSKEDLRDAIDIVAHEHSYHPVEELLKTLEWDGVPRLAELFPRYLGAERSGYTTAVTKLVLSGAIQRVLNPGIKFDYCLVIADKQQGTGKSSMCRILALSDPWFTDTLNDLSNDKSAFEALRGHWICELGEMMATRKTKTVEDIKAFISRLDDVYRTPYASYPEHYPRQCIFIGTSNKPQFLPDDKTGNRRFLPLVCDGRRAERHPLDDEAETREFVRQCYAEAIVRGTREGWQLLLPREYEDELSSMREESTPDDSKVGMIQEWLDEHREIDIVCTRLIWDKVFGAGIYRLPERYELQDIADIMNLSITGWEPYRGENGKSASNKYRFKNEFMKYGQQRAWGRIKESEPSAAPAGASGGAKNGGTGFQRWPEGEETPF